MPRPSTFLASGKYRVLEICPLVEREIYSVDAFVKWLKWFSGIRSDCPIVLVSGVPVGGLMGGGGEHACGA